MPKKINVKPGDRYSRLTILEELQTPRKGDRKFSCICDCGDTKEVCLHDLRRKHVQSCGCLSADSNFRHGMYGTPEYRCYRGMLKRCYNSTDRKYPLYGARGIQVCPEWRASFKKFYEDMGDRPGPDLSLDRIDNDKGYSKDNCRWATRVEQNRNKRTNRLLTVHEETLSLTEWAELMGLNRSTLHNRLGRGWSDEAAVLTPARPKTHPMTRL